MKKILATLALSSLTAFSALQAQTIQELNKSNEVPENVEAKLEQQKRQHFSVYDNSDKQLFNHVSIGITGGLDGLGAEFAVPVTPFCQIHGGYSFVPRISAKGQYNTTDVDFKVSNNRNIHIPANHKFPIAVDVYSGGPHLMLDLFLGRTSPFHFTVGAYYRHDKRFVNAKVDVSDLLDKTEYGGGVYYQLDAENRETRISADPDGCLHLGVYSGSPIRPYLGVGFGRSVDTESRVSVVFNMGVVFWGSPQVCSVYYGMADPDSELYRVDATGTPYMVVPIKGDDLRKLPADDNYAIESVADILDTFNRMPVFPMMKLSIFFRIF